MSKVRMYLFLSSFTLFALSAVVITFSQKVISIPICYQEDGTGQIIDLSHMCEQNNDDDDSVDAQSVDAQSVDAQSGFFTDAAYRAEYAKICREENCSSAADAIRVHLKACANLGINPGVVSNSAPTEADRLALEQAIRDSEEWQRTMESETDF